MNDSKFKWVSLVLGVWCFVLFIAAVSYYSNESNIRYFKLQSDCQNSKGIWERNEGGRCVYYRVENPQ